MRFPIWGSIFHSSEGTHKVQYFEYKVTNLDTKLDLMKHFQEKNGKTNIFLILPQTKLVLNVPSNTTALKRLKFPSDATSFSLTKLQALVVHETIDPTFCK